MNHYRRLNISISGPQRPTVQNFNVYHLYQVAHKLDRLLLYGMLLGISNYIKGVI